MHWIDLSIFGIYLIFMMGIGIYFMRRNKNADDYYVGGRGMRSMHIGLSVVATDVGGGFSIGLGGLGFVMGLAGTWLLFTGLIGAWLTAVVLVPIIAKLAGNHKFLSFPQFLELRYNKKIALLAGLISAIGYLGFTSSQILAGAKLASATFEGINLNTALLLMGIIAVAYTALGGLKAVIYTDTIQWIILLAGLMLVGIPMCYQAVGGMEAIRSTLPDEFFNFGNVSGIQLLNWFITIIPIWFIGMTLYQRIYAAKDKKTAVRAWFIAGIFEYPVMAFTGVVLGLFARVAFENGMFEVLGLPPGANMDIEMGLPLLLKLVLPVGLLGIMMSVYFSAIMSTADSCLMASSGNVLTDLLSLNGNKKNILMYSQLITLVLGTLAILIAMQMPNVLELVLHSYAFMVSGLFVPVLGALYIRKLYPLAALFSMLTGGTTTLFLIIAGFELPHGLDPNIFGLSASLIIFAAFNNRYSSRLLGYPGKMR